MVLYSTMSTLDLTADEHKLRRRTSFGLSTNIDRFRARLDYNYQALAVLATETSTDTWTVTTFPGVAAINADSNNEYSEDLIFYGGRLYNVANGLAIALSAAGYTVTGPGFSSGFSIGFDVA